MFVLTSIIDIIHQYHSSISFINTFVKLFPHGFVLDHQQSLNLKNGILVAVPIPSQHSAAGEEIEVAIKKALSQAKYVQIIFFASCRAGNVLHAFKYLLVWRQYFMEGYRLPSLLQIRPYFKLNLRISQQKMKTLQISTQSCHGFNLSMCQAVNVWR